MDCSDWGRGRVGGSLADLEPGRLGLLLRLRRGFGDPAPTTAGAVLVNRAAFCGLVQGARRRRDHLAGLLTALADGVARRTHGGPRGGAADRPHRRPSLGLADALEGGALALLCWHSVRTIPDA